MKRFRLYYDKDEEERWLSQMNAQGWALAHYFLGQYTFVPCEPNAYQYQIDLLQDLSEYDDYCQFMADSGVEVVQRWFRWVYLRKPTEDGPFQLYTDSASRSALYRRIRCFFRTIGVLNLLAFFTNFFNAINFRSVGVGFVALLSALAGIIMLRITWKCSWKIQQLEKAFQ